MIELKNVTKSFQDTKALTQVTAEIQNGLIFGLVGSNGAGKSTLLRLVSGILKPEEGEIMLDGRPVFEQCDVKKQICFLSDSAYYFPNATPGSMGRYYALAYPGFDQENYYSLLKKFNIPEKKKMQTFSKGQKKQVSILLGFCTGTRYLLCDETFDGLDPVARQAVKSIFAGELAEREFTPVIASHNLRELEDICDCVGILHQGGVLMQKDLEEMKLNIHNIQCVFQSPDDERAAFELLDIIKADRRGSLTTFTARGAEEEIMLKLNSFSPVFSEILPLTLEEIFISETEVVGYDIKKLIF
jgi:ABC-2 type transport system ATP-binding protein